MIKWTKRHINGTSAVPHRFLVDTTTYETLDAECHFKYIDDFIELPAALATTNHLNAYWSAGARVATGTSTITAGTNGLLVMSTVGHTANDAAELVWPGADWHTNSGLVMEARLQIPTVGVAEPDIEMGFRASANEYALIRVAVAGSVATATLNTNKAAAGNVAATGSQILTAATYYVLRLEVSKTRTCRFYCNNALIATTGDAVITLGATAVPMLYVADVTAHVGIQTLSIDAVRIFALDRA